MIEILKTNNCDLIYEDFIPSHDDNQRGVSISINKKYNVWFNSKTNEVFFTDKKLFVYKKQYLDVDTIKKHFKFFKSFKIFYYDSKIVPRYFVSRGQLSRVSNTDMVVIRLVLFTVGITDLEISTDVSSLGNTRRILTILNAEDGLIFLTYFSDIIFRHK